MKKTLTLLLTLALVVGVCAYEVARAAKPTLRQDPAHPLYTIGERTSYSAALADKTRVLKFGPMFWGLYPGGLAFETPQKARDYLRENDWDAARWSVYRLSGDYALDTAQGHITRSLLVVSEAQP
jgi:hypothetical protein